MFGDRDQIAHDCAEFLRDTFMEDKSIGLLQIASNSNMISIIDQQSNCIVTVYESDKGHAVFKVGGIVRDNADDILKENGLFLRSNYAGFKNVTDTREVRRLVYKFFLAKKQL